MTGMPIAVGAGKRCRVGAILSVAALLAAGPALAAPVASPQASSSALSQYVEVAPKAGGGSAAVGAGSQPSSGVSQYVEVVPTVGGSASRSRTQASRPTNRAKPASGSSSALGAAVNAIASGDERHVLGLGAAMLLVTVWLVAATALRHRRREAVRSEEG